MSASETVLWAATDRGSLVINTLQHTAGRRRLPRGEIRVALVDTVEQTRIRFETTDDAGFDAVSSARLDSDAVDELTDALGARATVAVDASHMRQHVETPVGEASNREESAHLSVSFGSRGMWTLWLESEHGRSSLTLSSDDAPSAVSALRQATRGGDRE